MAFDPRSVTVQREDQVNIFITLGEEQVLLHSYWGKEEWPTRPLLLPGNKLIFEFSTASSYVERDNREDVSTHYGYRALVHGYIATDVAHPLRLLERELAFLGGQCASMLLSGAPAAGGGCCGGGGGAVGAGAKDKDKKVDKDEKDDKDKKDGKDKDKKDGKDKKDDKGGDRRKRSEKRKKGGGDGAGAGGAGAGADGPTLEHVRTILSSLLFSRGLSPLVLPSLEEAMQGLSLDSIDFTSRTGVRETYEYVFLREFIDLVGGSAGGRLAA